MNKVRVAGRISRGLILSCRVCCEGDWSFTPEATKAVANVHPPRTLPRSPSFLPARPRRLRGACSRTPLPAAGHHDDLYFGTLSALSALLERL
jgi:hypothetical protein